MRAHSPVLVAALLAMAPAFADPIEIDFVNPTHKKAKPGLPTVVPSESFSGWPLSIELTMNGELGIASEGRGEPPSFPLSGDTGFVVFTNADDCLILDWRPGEPGSWSAPSGPGCYNDEFELVITESDETYFEFSVDQDSIGAHDSVGNPGRIAALTEATSGRPIINPGGQFPAAIGPFTSLFETNGSVEQEIVDGYGYGADDDVPGLVLVARHGSGIVYQDNGVMSMPLQLYNLAGFASSVSYELNNAKNKTTIQVQFIMPSYLIAPVVVADDDVSGPPGTSVLWRVDGAAQVQSASDVVGETVTATYESGYPMLVGHFEYVVSAMAVSGTAPDRVMDMNGDDTIDHHDLALMGHNVLGEAKSVTFRVFPAQACHGGSGQNTVYADLDGNGGAIGTLNCPSGSGSLSKPPR